MRLSLRPTAARRGFTLVELMIVVGIVILLVAMATAAVLRFRSTGPHIATQMNLSKIKSAFDTQWKAVRDQAQKEPISDSLISNLGFPAGTKAGNLEVRKRYIEAKLRQCFPLTFAEALNPTPLSPLPTYNTLIRTLLNIPAVKTPAQAEADAKKILEDMYYSSQPEIKQAATVYVHAQLGICLQMVLERGPSNGGLSPDQLGTSASVRVTLPGINQTTYACVDAWGNPLLYTRRKLNSINLEPAILSCGPDGKHGVDLTQLLPPMPPPPLPNQPTNPINFTLAVIKPGEAEDNIGTHLQ